MGLFDFLKKKETEEVNETAENSGGILLAMPLFTNGNRHNIDAVVNELKTNWELNVSSEAATDDSAILMVNGMMVAVAFMPATIPGDDLENAAQYAYNWENAVEEMKQTDGHTIVSVMGGSASTVEKYKILSKVLCSILTTSESIGIYQGSQTLLLKKDQYLDYASSIKNDDIPVPLWMYIGIRTSEKGNSVYTYGLKEFGKSEMEVVDSQMNLGEIYNFILNICSYVIKSDVTFRDGETLGYTAEQKIEITLSKGIFLEGETLKLKM